MSLPVFACHSQLATRNSSIHSLPIGPDLDAVFLEKIEAAAGNPALQEDAVVVVIVDTVLNLSVLGQVGQDAPVRHARFDFGVEGAFEQGLADGLFQVFKALA